jgi:hypothetical protein
LENVLAAAPWAAGEDQPAVCLPVSGLNDDVACLLGELHPAKSAIAHNKHIDENARFIFIIMEHDTSHSSGYSPKVRTKIVAIWSS